MLEDGTLRRTMEGTPQGGVASPLLSNIFLHYVLDEWYERDVRPRMERRCTLVRYADDAVLAFEGFLDGQRVLRVLGKRMARFGLEVHPEKTRMIDFRFMRPDGLAHPATEGTTITFLGFTHVWGKSRNGKNVVRQVTDKRRYARALHRVSDECRRRRHHSIRAQHAWLSAMLRGHYGYYGITGNSRRLRWFAHQVERIWKKWLSRRGQPGTFHWDRLNAMLKAHPLPPPKVVHRYAAASEPRP